MILHRLLPCVLLLAPPVAPSRAEPLCGSLRIDLVDPDRADLERLPWILDEEIERLLEASGPGPGNLEERLASAGIPRDRWRIWAPYLIVSRPAGGIGTSGRLRAAGAGGLRGGSDTELHLRIGGRPLGGIVVWDDPIVPSGADRARLREVRLAAGLGPTAMVWVGSITGTIPGGNLWDDPLERPGTGSVSAPRFRLGTSRGSRGAALAVGAVDLAVWRTPQGEDGLLLSLTGRDRSVEIGAREGRGRGISTSFPLRGGTVTAGLHRPQRHAVCVQVRFHRRKTDDRLAVAWSPDQRPDRNDLRLDAGSSCRFGAWNFQGSLALLAGGGSTVSRAAFALRGGGSSGPSHRPAGRRGSTRPAVQGGIAASWDEKGSTLRGEIEHLVAAGWRARTVVRLGYPSSKRGTRWEWGLRRALGPTTADLTLLARSSAAVAWPGTPAGNPIGRVAVQIRLERRAGSRKIESVLLVPFVGSAGASVKGIAWRLAVEQRWNG